MRVFLGIELPDRLRDDLALQQYLLPLPRRILQGDFHLTLVFCGEAHDHQLQELHDALGEMRAMPFELHLSGFGLFGGAKPHAAWAGIAPSQALMKLQSRVEALARNAGMELPHRRFHPHVTLGRFPRPGPEAQMRLERAIAAGSGYTAGPWEVREITLWQSELTRDGPRYSVLARYPFADARRPRPAVS